MNMTNIKPFQISQVFSLHCDYSTRNDYYIAYYNLIWLFDQNNRLLQLSHNIYQLLIQTHTNMDLY